MRKTKLLCLLYLICAIGCSTTTTPRTVDTGNLHQLSNMNNDISTRRSDLDVSPMRATMLNDTAMSIGAQSGLAWAASKINKQLTRDAKKLDQIFNFSPMLLSHGVIPPVLVSNTGELNLTDHNTIRIADKSYKILKQAHFATTPPHWREYLWLNYQKPEPPETSLLPRSSAEQQIWSKAVKLGWNKGIQQAFIIFQQNLTQLKRDYQGMILYLNLLQHHMINPPFVSTTSLGVTGDGTDMRINDQVIRITDLPQLQTTAKKWRSIVVSQP